MKVVILTTEQGNQVALCYRLMTHCEVAGIVLSKNLPRKPLPYSRRLHGLISRTSVRLLGGPLLAAWDQLQKAYRDRYPVLPEVPIVRVNNVNDAPTVEMLREHKPDLIVVSGTNLVGRKLMESVPPKCPICEPTHGHLPICERGAELHKLVPVRTNVSPDREYRHVVGPGYRQREHYCDRANQARRPGDVV